MIMLLINKINKSAVNISSLYLHMLQPQRQQKLSKSVHLDIMVHLHSEHFSLLIEIGVVNNYLGHRNLERLDLLKFSARRLQVGNCSVSAPSTYMVFRRVRARLL